MRFKALLKLYLQDNIRFSSSPRTEVFVSEEVTQRLALYRRNAQYLPTLSNIKIVFQWLLPFQRSGLRVMSV